MLAFQVKYITNPLLVTASHQLLTILQIAVHVVVPVDDAVVVLVHHIIGATEGHDGNCI